jgi:hypothetical protein
MYIVWSNYRVVNCAINNHIQYVAFATGKGKFYSRTGQEGPERERERERRGKRERGERERERAKV